MTTRIATRLALFTFALPIFALTTLLPLVQQGMFADGVTYAALANNLANSMANDNGSWYNLSLSPGLYTQFYMHPPLVIWIESLFFRVLGNYWWTERVFVLFNSAGLLVTLLGVAASVATNTAVGKVATPNGAALTLILWLCIPLVFWATTANILETTMCIFTNITAIATLKWLNKKSALWFFVAVLTTLAAFFCKGPTALFVWAIPFLYLFMIEKNADNIFIKLLKSALLPLLSTLLFIILYLKFMPLRTFFTHYFEQQIQGDMLHDVTDGSRFYIIFSTLQVLIIPIILSILGLCVAFRNDFTQMRKVYAQPNILFCFAVGLCTILPIMLTLKQRDFYVFCGLPFWIIGFSLPFAGILTQKIGEIRLSILKKIIAFFSFCGICALVFCFTQMGKIGRKDDSIAELQHIVNIVKPNQKLYAPMRFYTNWSVQAYLARFGNIGLVYQAQDATTPYLLTTQEEPIYQNYTLLTQKTDKYILYEKNK
jgi:4-amino-4-deoxy-L-arabinose transferase-like glycosyltransferase